MNPLIKALKIIGFFILFFMLLNESFACKINREFYDRTEKDIFNSNEIILIGKVKEHKRIGNHTPVVEFQVLKSIKGDYKEDSIIINNPKFSMCHFNSFLSEIGKGEISSLYVKENDSSPKKNALKYNIDFGGSKKYDSYSEALSELERIENTPTFYYKYIELKDKHLIDKNIQLALILSIFILVLLILRIFQNRKYIVLHFLLTLIFLYFYFKLYGNSSKWDEEPIFFIFSMTYMTIGGLIFVKLKLSNNLGLYVKILLVLLFILYLLVLCMIDHRINKILLSPF